MTDQPLADRVARLERENRKLKRAGLAILAMGGVTLLMGQSAPANRTVEAGKFKLVDKDGQNRGGLLILADGSPALLLGGKDGLRVGMAVRPDGTSSLEQYDKAGKLRTSIGPQKGGGWGLRLTDSQGRDRARLTVNSDDRPVVTLFNEEGGLVFEAHQDN